MTIDEAAGAYMPSARTFSWRYATLVAIVLTA